MNPAVLSVLRTFFARSDRPRLRRDLVGELRLAFDGDHQSAEEMVGELLANEILCAMQVHFYDRDAEDMVQADGVRPGGRFRGDAGSGTWRAVAGRA